MNSIIAVLAALFACALAQPGGNNPVAQLFATYAGADNQFQQAEFNRFWLHFDTDNDGQIHKLEFDSVWRHESLPNPQNAPLFFLELDRVKDEVINNLDFPHIFRMFDENGESFSHPNRRSTLTSRHDITLQPH
ncbi:unnamed protein product [Lymnaea stagnalis]|uniref:EF-hand domain-containing protein n=1 Tax=Lymnaea stagnalis TaxID=6523 RepID=A0AAV2HU70_LYMST